MHPFIYAFAAGVMIFAWKRYICKKPIGKWFKTGCVVCGSYGDLLRVAYVSVFSGPAANELLPL